MQNLGCTREKWNKAANCSHHCIKSKWTACPEAIMRGEEVEEGADWEKSMSHKNKNTRHATLQNILITENTTAESRWVGGSSINPSAKHFGHKSRQFIFNGCARFQACKLSFAKGCSKRYIFRTCTGERNSYESLWVNISLGEINKQNSTNTKTRQQKEDEWSCQQKYDTLQKRWKDVQ